MLTLDPRTKILLGLAAATAVAACRRPESMFALSLLPALALPFRPHRRILAATLRLGLPVAALVFALSLASVDPATAAVSALRVLDLVVVSGAWFRCMSPEEFADALRLWRVPYPLVFVLTTSLRYVPLLSDRLRRIREAQRCRGIDLRLRLRNGKHLTALFLPLTVQSFILAEQLAMAMEARGFSRKGRTLRRSYRIKTWEILFLGGWIALLGGLLWWEHG